MKLADAHLHLFRSGYADRYGAAWANPHELELYETFRRVHDIEHGLVIGYEGQPKFRGNNRDVAAWARKHSWITPLAFLPVTTVPLPDIVNTSSIGIKNGLSVSLLGCGM